jgi:MoxR-like ATPase
MIDRVAANVARVVHTDAETLQRVVLCLVSEGHLIIEDFPGVGKTMLVKALARSLDCTFSRIQFTPDLLPTDITGVNVFDQRTNEFDFRAGPVFANLLLVDEVNRASPKTQSALLECMQEAQVTVDGVSYALPRPFMVAATQNPIEYEGTYPLPEAQLDRFAMRQSLGYPPLAEEARMLTQHGATPLDALEPVWGHPAARRHCGRARDLRGEREPVRRGAAAVRGAIGTWRSARARGRESRSCACEVAPSWSGGVRRAGGHSRARGARALPPALLAPEAGRPVSTRTWCAGLGGPVWRRRSARSNPLQILRPRGLVGLRVDAAHSRGPRVRTRGPSARGHAPYAARSRSSAVFCRVTGSGAATLRSGPRPASAGLSAARSLCDGRSARPSGSPACQGAASSSSRRSRGRHRLGPRDTAIVDPLGLERVEHRLDETDVLVRPHPVQATVFSAHGLREAGSARSAFRRPTGFEIHAIRDYAPGEPLRAVHWPNTARRGQLMVKSRRRTARGRRRHSRPRSGRRRASGSVELRRRGSRRRRRRARPSLAGRRVVVVGTGPMAHPARARSTGHDWEGVLDVLAAVEPVVGARIATGRCGRRQRSRDARPSS